MIRPTGRGAPPRRYGSRMKSRVLTRALVQDIQTATTVYAAQVWQWANARPRAMTPACLGIAFTALSFKEYLLGVALLLVAAWFAVVFVLGRPTHQSPATILSRIIRSLPIVILTIAATVWVVKLKGNDPWSLFFARSRLAAEVVCSLPPNFSPCEISCTVENNAAVPIRDLAISFNGLLPRSLALGAPPHYRVRLERSDTIPIPAPDGHVDLTAKAYVVIVPLAPSSEKINFSLWTNDSQNKQACAQYVKLSERQKQFLDAFYGAVRQVNRSKLPRREQVLSAQLKDSALFHPDRFSSDAGSGIVVYKTAAEMAAQLEFQAIYPRLRPLVTLSSHEECMAPVFIAEGSNEEPVTFALLLPFVTTFIDMEIPRLLRKEDIAPEMSPRPPVPTKYDCTLSP